MANEITVSASLQYLNPAQNIPQVLFSLLNQVYSITGKNYEWGSMSVPTTAGGTVIPVANLSSLGWSMFKNNDSTNYVDLLSATSGTAFARLMPGESALFRINPGITAPAALAHTAAVLITYLILEN
jgi:hypothetical protein